jgi:hypothetical protein
MNADMILDHLGHQAGDRAARRGHQLHDLSAAGIGIQRLLNRLDLAAQTRIRLISFCFSVTAWTIVTPDEKYRRGYIPT